MPFHAVMMALASLPTARRLHARYAFDCIDAHFVYPDGTAAVLLGKFLGLPVIVTARGTDVTRYSTFRLIRPMLRWTYREAAGIVAVSESLRQEIMELGVPAENVKTITNGIDAERFVPMDRRVARRRLGLADDDSIVVNVGNLNAVKSQEFLVSAMALLAPRHPMLRLYLIGDGPRKGSLQELIVRKHLQEQVILVGSIANEDLGPWFSAADLTCLVSMREGWPNVVTESLACGTPVVATRVGGVPEIISSPEMGLFVEREPESIAEGIETALRRSWERNKISEQIRKRTWDRVAEETENYFGECVGRARLLRYVKSGSNG
jgi:glycosyltransferase involved in cell wall biosynthesis